MPDATKYRRLTPILAPQECRLMRGIWQMAGCPDPQDFDPICDLAWLLEFQDDRRAEGFPWYRLMPAGDRYAMALSKDGWAVLVELVKGTWAEDPRMTRVRVFPRHMSVAGFSAQAHSFAAFVLHEKGEARVPRRLLVPSLINDGIPCHSGFVVRRAPHEGTLPHSMTAHERLALAADVIAAAEEEKVWEAARRAAARWPASLCRSMICDRNSFETMRAILGDLAELVSAEAGHGIALALVIDRPAETHDAIFPRATCSTSLLELNERVEAFMQTAFFKACREEWPEGWMETVGPRRAARPLAETWASRLDGVFEGQVSWHRRLALYKKFGAPEASQEKPLA